MILITDYDTDFLGEVLLYVEYDYQPPQVEILHPAEDSQEGFEEEFTVTNVRAALNGVLINITSHIPEDHIDVLADLCMEDYHSEH